MRSWSIRLVRDVEGWQSGDLFELAANFAVTLLGAWANEVGPQSVAAFTDPADLFGRVADHEREIRHVLGHHGAGANHGELADLVPANDDRVGADRGAPTDMRREEFILALYVSARGQHVGEDHAGAAEHIIFQRDAGIDGDVVLDLAAVSDRNIGSD